MSGMKLSQMEEDANGGEKVYGEDDGENEDEDDDSNASGNVRHRNNSGGNHVEKRNSEERKNSEYRRMVDITRDKPVKLTVRVVVPVRDHPKFNFVGKLLGPKGNSLKRLQEDTMTKMAILGRGSMRDKLKEEEMRSSGDPKFSHLHDDLHVEITAFAPPAEAHARMAYALADIRRFLIPDYNDDIRQEQMWEMQVLKERPDPPKINPEASGMQVLGVAASGTSAGPDASTSTNSEESSCRQKPSGPDSVGPSMISLSRHPVSGSVAVHPFPVGATTSVGSMARRKRPLFSGSSKHSLSPTKRTVLSILDRARTAQSKQLNTSNEIFLFRRF